MSSQQNAGKKSGVYAFNYEIRKEVVFYYKIRKVVCTPLIVKFKDTEMHF